MRIRAGTATDVGLIRERNEDSLVAEHPLYAVADGLGGHQGGEVASGLALQTVRSAFEGEVLEELVPETLASAVRRANEAVHEQAAGDSELKGMGTTVTAVVAGAGRLYLAHVGDSRGYLLRDGEMRQITEDHTLVHRLVEEGRLTREEAAIHPQRSVLTRALGIDDDLDVDQATIEVTSGDRILLCSDGLSSMIGDEEIHAVLAPEDDPQRASERLIAAALEAGGHDNITVLVLDVLEAEPVPEAVPADARAREAGPVPEMAPAHAGAGEAAPPEPAASAPGPVRPRSGGSRWRRRLAWAVVVLVVLGGLLLGVKAYVDRQWYVGVHEGRVAIFRGLPVTVLGIELSSVEEETELPAAEAATLHPWAGLEDGITASSREDARAIVEEIGRDLEALVP